MSCDRQTPCLRRSLLRMWQSQWCMEYQHKPTYGIVSGRCYSRLSEEGTAINGCVQKLRGPFCGSPCNKKIPRSSARPCQDIWMAARKGLEGVPAIRSQGSLGDSGNLLLDLKNPEGPSTQHLRSLVPKAINSMVFGTRVLKYWVLGPSRESNISAWSITSSAPSSVKSPRLKTLKP